MNERCRVGALRSLLHDVLEDDGCQGNKDRILHAALSKVQKSLILSPLSCISDEKLDTEVEDCAVSRDARSACLKDIEGLASDLVVFLASDNRFIKHSAGKTFVALFGCLHGSGSPWISLLGFLWSTLNGCFDGDHGSITCKPVMEGISGSRLLKHGSCTFDFRIAPHLLEILHKVLRKFKLEGASTSKDFLVYSAAHISKVLVAFSIRFKCLINNPIESKPEEEDDIVLAALMRVLCSIMHSLCMHPDSIDILATFSDNSIENSLISFLEAVSGHCLTLDRLNRLSHYLRHKLLMLMFRLHDRFIKWPSLALTCSEILRVNMTSLCPSLFVRHTPAPAPLLLSPFAARLTQTETQFCQPEKHAVFLIFKLEISSIRRSVGSSTRSIENHVSSAGEEGTQWMYKWLLSQLSLPDHLPKSGTAVIADYLASSFLQIFLDEDTSLLEILLLLQDSPFSDLFPGSLNDNSSQRAEKLLIEIFKPIRLFAVFLSLISYDHSVMIDFLIEKDTGILCLQYLLRSMRLVGSTWPELLTLSEASASMLTQKDESSIHDKVIDIHSLGRCLVKLRHAMQKLHQKHAFPYNPSALLKHLDLFEHLWSGSSS